MVKVTTSKETYFERKSKEVVMISNLNVVYIYFCIGICSILNKK